MRADEPTSVGAVEDVAGDAAEAIFEDE